MGTGSKGAIGKVLVGVLVGGGAVWLASFAVARVEALQKYPWIPPALLAGTAFLLYKRGRHASALGLAGAVGVLGLMMLQAKGYLGAPMGEAKAQVAGWADASGGAYTDAGAYMMRPDSGWREREAGVFQGAAAPALLEQQQALGYADAGTLMGPISERVREAMGLAS